MNSNGNWWFPQGKVLFLRLLPEVPTPSRAPSWSWSSWTPLVRSSLNKTTSSSTYFSEPASSMGPGRVINQFRDQGAIHYKDSVFPDIVIPIMKIRRSSDRLIFIIGISVQVRRRFFILKKILHVKHLHYCHGECCYKRLWSNITHLHEKYTDATEYILNALIGELDTCVIVDLFTKQSHVTWAADRRLTTRSRAVLKLWDWGLCLSNFTVIRLL